MSQRTEFDQVPSHLSDATQQPQLGPSDDDNIHFEEAVSDKGDPYRTGFGGHVTIDGVSLSIAASATAMGSEPATTDTSTPAPPKPIDVAASASASTTLSSFAAQSKSKVGSIDVDWQVTVQGEITNKVKRTWLSDEECSATAIQGYFIVHNPAALFYKYTLYIMVEKSADYWFIDEEGDRYSIRIVRPNNGKTPHFIWYNSKKPAIKQVVYLLLE
ncbi:hypothetical protein FA15DRAFT_674374 [Coprinopsis marcescibilis]|uniref:Uncharacterized protein n=1 Tax=Coprinopsis marcescibilis TaxID=230819 RepID=A0A5C3KUD7_COPMA|nr:hypothetical protein FA15DRAFT_674374 [Coprinopsis marcescibilis]